MKTNGELVPMNGEPQREMTVMREPSIVLGEARRAAVALQDVISKTAKPLVMNGKQYLTFEHWGTLAHFYGLMVKTHNAEPCEVEGVKGARARAEVIDLKSGHIVGSAESYCMRDETNWRGKPWFQLASMAQTRAGAKSLRNVLSWVAVLAGYSPTPAEEVVEEAGGTVVQAEPVFPSASVSAPRPTMPRNGPKISEPQAKRFYAIAKSAGKSDAEIKAHIKARYGIESSRDLTRDVYEAACTWAGTKSAAPDNDAIEPPFMDAEVVE